MKSRKRSDDIYEEENPFELPRSITKALKRCVQDHAPARTDGRESVKYLWLYLSSAGRKPSPNGRDKELGGEEWLNILDEAASLGVQCVLACVSTPLSDYPMALSICQWAQDTHNMRVGLFVHKGLLTDADMDLLDDLDRSKMCVFLREEGAEDGKLVSSRGLAACSGSVTEKDHTPPCDLPEDMLCVGPDGSLYTCGLVLGNDEFKLGNALATPLRRVIDDGSKPRVVPHDAPYERHGCDACPPIMAKRVMEFGKESAE